MAEKKKRSRDPLAGNAHEERWKKQDSDVSLSYLKEGNPTDKKRQDEVAPRTQRHTSRVRWEIALKSHIRRKKGGFLSSAKILEAAFNAPVLWRPSQD